MKGRAVAAVLLVLVACGPLWQPGTGPPPGPTERNIVITHEETNSHLRVEGRLEGDDESCTAKQEVVLRVAGKTGVLHAAGSELTDTEGRFKFNVLGPVTAFELVAPKSETCLAATYR